MAYDMKLKHRLISSRRDPIPTSPVHGSASVASGERSSIIASLMDSTSISIGALSPLSRLSYNTLRTPGGKHVDCTNLCFEKYSHLSYGGFLLLKSSSGMILTKHSLNNITSLKTYRLTMSGQENFTFTSGMVGDV